jgi:hypothetical protein
MTPRRSQSPACGCDRKQLSIEQKPFFCCFPLSLSLVRRPDVSFPQLTRRTTVLPSLGELRLRKKKKQRRRIEKKMPFPLESCSPFRSRRYFSSQPRPPPSFFISLSGPPPAPVPAPRHRPLLLEPLLGLFCPPRRGQRQDPQRRPQEGPGGKRDGRARRHRGPV